MIHVLAMSFSRRAVVAGEADFEFIEVAFNRIQRAAQVFLAMIPIMVVYTFGSAMGIVKE